MRSSRGNFIAEMAVTVAVILFVVFLLVKFLPGYVPFFSDDPEEIAERAGDLENEANANILDTDRGMVDSYRMLISQMNDYGVWQLPNPVLPPDTAYPQVDLSQVSYLKDSSGWNLGYLPAPSIIYHMQENLCSLPSVPDSRFSVNLCSADGQCSAIDDVAMILFTSVAALADRISYEPAFEEYRDAEQFIVTVSDVAPEDVISDSGYYIAGYDVIVVTVPQLFDSLRCGSYDGVVPFATYPIDTSAGQALSNGQDVALTPVFGGDSYSVNLKTHMPDGGSEYCFERADLDISFSLIGAEFSETCSSESAVWVSGDTFEIVAEHTSGELIQSFKGYSKGADGTIKEYVFLIELV